MKATKVLLGAASYLVAAQLLAGEAVFYITEDGSAVRDLAVSVNGQKKLIGSSGFVTFDIGSGNYRVELSKYGEYVGEFDFTANSSKENAEIQVELIGGEAMADVNLYVPGDEATPALGQLSGFIQSDETGGGVAGASVVVNGTEQAIVTDDKGYFSLELPRGDYSLVIAHPNYGKRDVKSVRVMGNVNTGLNLTLSMSGDGMIEEVVAVGSYIPSTATAQQRDSSAVLDAIGAEQFSRFSDTNAAAALKRVTGVSIADGKYAVVRGLNERYTSVLLNGGMIPSPDPTRRVVPLDIFPSGIVKSLNVEKTAIANRPTDAAGATIDILTKTAPEEFEGKVSVTLGYNDITTGNSVLTQDRSGAEYFGYGSSNRDLSGEAKNFTGETTGSAGANLLNLSQLKAKKSTMTPDTRLEVEVGDRIAETSAGTVAYNLNGRYYNKWSYREEDRATYEPVGDGTINEGDEYIRYRAVNLIDLSLAGTLSLISDNNTLNSHTMLLRQTQSDNIEELGVRGEYRNFSVERDFSWQEREFITQQFTGEHFFGEFFDAEVDWGATFSSASMSLPDSQSYRYYDDSKSIGQDDYFNPLADDRSSQSKFDFSTKPQREWTELNDDSTHLRVDGQLNVVDNDSFVIKLSSGFSYLSRERDVETNTFQYDLTGSQPAGFSDVNNVVDVINSDSFETEYVKIIENTDEKSNYKGVWDYSSFYLMPRFEWYDLFSLEVGARFEDSVIDVETKSLNSVSSKIEDSKVYPSLNATLSLSESSQFRLAYSQSINRPDFREVAPAQFIDSVSGERYVGNENLTSSDVDSVDLRYEYYFSDDESINIAFFRKDFKNAIERTSSVISGSSNDILYSYANNGDAIAQGVEVSASKNIEVSGGWFRFSGNISYFDTEMDIFTASGNLDKTRRMQGQPDIIGNLQIAFDEYSSGRQYTLIYNYSGESLSSVTTSDLLDDQYRKPRAELDANFMQPFMDDRLSLKVSLKNLTDEAVKETQNGLVTKRYKTGREFRLGVTYQF